MKAKYYWFYYREGWASCHSTNREQLDGKGGGGQPDTHFSNPPPTPRPRRAEKLKPLGVKAKFWQTSGMCCFGVPEYGSLPTA